MGCDIGKYVFPGRERDSIFSIPAYKIGSNKSYSNRLGWDQSMFVFILFSTSVLLVLSHLNVTAGFWVKWRLVGNVQFKWTHGIWQLCDVQKKHLKTVLMIRAMSSSIFFFPLGSNSELLAATRYGILCFIIEEIWMSLHDKLWSQPPNKGKICMYSNKET